MREGGVLFTAGEIARLANGPFVALKAVVEMREGDDRARAFREPFDNLQQLLLDADQFAKEGA